MQHYRYIIIGQGLAGTAVAWWLHWQQVPFLIVDREPPVTSSKIAAGLITPITGKKLIPSWRLLELWPSAIEFYRHVEQTLQNQVLDQPTMVRLFADDTEIANFERRQREGQYEGLIQPLQQRLDPRQIHAPLGGIEMQPTAKLDTATYLTESRLFFEKHAAYQCADIKLEQDLELETRSIRCLPINVSCDRMIFCQGIDAMTNPWFKEVKFKPAKGEILTVEIPEYSDKRVLHQGVWLAPAGEGVFQTGATYDWKQLDQVPTRAGRDEVLAKLEEFLLLPVRVMEHRAAVRPVHNNQYPVLGIHPEFPQLVYFNGLGSKGSLHAPYFAKHLLAALAGETALEREVDLARKSKHKT